MKVLVINCGSSSLKYQLIDMDTKDVLAKGLAERIGMEGSVLTHKPAGKDEKEYKEALPNHEVALKILLNALVDPVCGVINSLKEIDAVGHRVLHGGETYKHSVIIDDEVMDFLNDLIDLGPLHMPANIMGIKACMEVLPSIPMVAVFDTAFHQSMPKEAFLYPIPYEYYTKYKVRKYGFHGTSHQYVSMRAAEMLGKKPEELKLVTCHLGNGSSISAVKNGKSVANSMGFTPLDGLAMGTRSGSVDPAVVKFISDKENKTVDEIDIILNKQSGVLGISGISSDFRDLTKAASEGNERAKLALEVFCYRVRTTIGAYITAMEGIDGIVFTAGVGENSCEVRKMICEHLTFLLFDFDEEANKTRGKETFISTRDSRLKVMVIPTNEELMIALDTQKLVETKNA